MASSTGRHRLEVPTSLYDELARVAAERGYTVTELASYWLHDRLEREGYHAPDPRRHATLISRRRVTTVDG